MQISWRYASFASMALLIVGTMTTVLGDQGHAASAKRPKRAGINSVTRVEILASGFKAISGIAVEASGAVLVTDRARGTLTRIDPSGTRHRLLDRLHQPRAVAVSGTGDLLVLDEDGGRLVRLGADGSLSVVTSALEQARAIAVGPDGRIWVASRQMNSQGDRGRRSRKARASEYGIVRVEPSGALTTLASGFRDVTGIAADAAHVYVAMGYLATERRRQRTTLALVHAGADGKTGLVERLLPSRSLRTHGVAVDVVGNLLVSGAANKRSAKSAGTIVKRRRSGEVSTLAAGLGDSVALAFAPNGDLIAADSRRGRVLRFKTTPAPAVVAPLFTNQPSLRVRGRSMPGALVQAFHDPNLTGLLATATAGAKRGRFALDVPLGLNIETRLSLLATAARGAGLVSTQSTLYVVHDDRRPTVAITEPPAGVHVSDLVTLRARGEDEGTGLAALTFMLDDAVVEWVENPSPGRSFVATAQLDTRQVLEGPRTVTVVATDLAANTAADARLLIVDRTPPDTQIVTGPPEETADGTAFFTFSGTDVQSVDLDFAWRLDAGVWSAFSASSVAEFASLTPGVHRFEVKARDSAGHEDPTPAAQTFIVTALRVRILEPLPDAVITSDTIWVRGVVEGSGPDVAVTISLPPELRDELSLEMVPAATEAGTFAAEVLVTPTMTAVTVTAVEGQNATVTDEVAIRVQGPLSGPTRFEAFPAAGLAPLTTRFATDPFPAGSVYTLDLNSDGMIEYEGDTLTGQVFAYARPGIHVATLRVGLADGQQFEARTAVEVRDRAALEARLQAVWGTFRGALSMGDVAGAVSFVHTDRRARWEEYFRQFTPDLFTATETVFADLTLLEVGTGRAECEMMREVDGLLYSFPISFVIDVDGGWRLWQF